MAKSNHLARLDRVRQDLHEARVAARQADLEADTADAHVNRLREEIVAAHAEGATKAVGQLTEQLAEQKLIADQARMKADGYGRRIPASEHDVAQFIADNHAALFAEMEPQGVEARDRLASAARELIAADAAWVALRSRADDLLSHVPNASPAADSPAEHHLAAAVREVRQALQAGDVARPTPHWRGKRSHEQSERANLLAKLKGKPKKSAQEERQMERLRHELQSDQAA